MTSPSVPTAGPEPGRPDTATKTARRSEDSALEIEQFTIAQIPEDQRHGRPRDLFTIWFTSNLIPLTILTGALATVTFTLPFWPAVLAILIGNLVGGLFMALHSAQGPRLGVPQMIQSRAQYGTIGALLVVGVVVFMYLGFFASNMILGGQALNQLVSRDQRGLGHRDLRPRQPGDRGVRLQHDPRPEPVAGHRVRRGDGDDRASSPWRTACRRTSSASGKFTWAAFVSAAVTTGVLWQIAYAPYVSDYSRYMSADKGVRPTFWYSYWGVVLGSAGPMIIGALVGAGRQQRRPGRGDQQAVRRVRLGGDAGVRRRHHGQQLDQRLRRDALLDHLRADLPRGAGCPGPGPAS